MIRAVFLAVALSGGSAGACEFDVGVPMRPQSQDAPEVAVVIAEIPLAQPFSVKLQLCGDGAVTALGVDAVMPAHQHGMNYEPTISDLGNGVFQADGLVFHMPGVWEIQVELMLETGVSHYTHSVTLR